MNNKEIFRKIGVIITELSDQHAYLAENPGSLNEFELELLRANVNFLSDHVEILQKLALAESKHEPAAKEESPVPAKEWSFAVSAKETEGAEPAEQETEKQQSATDNTESSPSEPPTSPAEAEFEKALPVAEEVTAPPIDNDVPEPAPTAEEPAEAAIKEADDEPKTVVNEVVIRERTIAIDLPEPEKKAPTLNELLSAAKTNSASTVGSQFNSPISDLKSSVNLNDKLLFVKELFNGYSLAYSEAIDLLNRFDNYDNAYTFLQSNYAVKNKWETKPVVSTKFYDLLKRRFGQS